MTKEICSKKFEKGDFKRHRVLFVYRDLPDDTRHAKATEYLVTFLQKKYDLETQANLSEDAIELIRSAPADKRFAALVTHVPYKLSSVRRPCGASHFMRERIEVCEAYEDSLLILRQIKIINDIPVIAYTGAGDSSTVIEIFWEGGGVDQVIPKTLDLKKDAQKITYALDRLITKYEKLPLSIPEPVIKIEDGFTIVKVKVNLNGGVGFVSAAAIAKESKGYPHKVLFKKVADPEDTEIYDAKAAWDFIWALLPEGKRIKILVEGVDQEANNLCRSLHRAFSSRYHFTMDLK